MELSMWASSWLLRRLALVRLLGPVPIGIHGRPVSEPTELEKIARVFRVSVDELTGALELV